MNNDKAGSFTEINKGFTATSPSGAVTFDLADTEESIAALVQLVADLSAMSVIVDRDIQECRTYGTKLKTVVHNRGTSTFVLTVDEHDGSQEYQDKVLGEMETIASILQRVIVMFCAECEGEEDA